MANNRMEQLLRNPRAARLPEKLIRGRSVGETAVMKALPIAGVSFFVALCLGLWRASRTEAWMSNFKGPVAGADHGRLAMLEALGTAFLVFVIVFVIVAAVEHLRELRRTYGRKE